MRLGRRGCRIYLERKPWRRMAGTKTRRRMSTNSISAYAFIGKRLQTFPKTKMASSVVDLPKDTLRIMQTVLTRLQKSRGPVSMEKLWSGVAVNDV